jgi:murein hydrolase activator
VSVRRTVRLLTVAGVLALAGGLAAQQQPNPQQQITESQRRLQEIRTEREQLRRELQRIRGQVSDVSTEIRNIQQQTQVSASLLREINVQVEETERLIDQTTHEIVATQHRLQEKRSLLNRRLRDIYKRGPVQYAEVLLSAHSFSDLLNRYKYVHLVARRDRELVTEVSELARQLDVRERELRRALADVRYLHNERESEHQMLQQLQSQRGRTLTTLRSHERTTAQQIEALARDERRITSLLAELERRRREAERREAERREAERLAAARTGAPAPAAPVGPVAGSITTADMGNLDWPVGGRIVYNFGRATLPNGTAIRNNGIGIAAAAGTPVRAVEAGTVEMAAPFEGYGPTVVVSHGGGYYSLYLYLKDMHVRPGTPVTKGQVIGTVGGEHTREGAHVEFQIREPGGGAVDPLTWLRRRAQ